MGKSPGAETRTKPKKEHTEGQIVAVLRQVEAGERVPTFAARWGSTGGLLPVEDAYAAKLESTTAMASVTAAIQRIPTLSLLVWVRWSRSTDPVIFGQRGSLTTGEM